jgi:hypothetical protein
MNIIYYTDFTPSMQFLNPNTFFVYVEAAQGRGGNAGIIQLRNSRQGLPLTLIEQYLQEGLVGNLQGETSERDMRTVEEQFQKINFVLRSGAVVWLPSREIQTQITSLEKSSPKMAGYALKRLEHLTLNFSPPNIELP